ncbi:MAG: hypothetical protein JNL64_13280, partial [Blastocatellia bacterium]|nr:hypothetical protein [Blastocatellia bacterium]
MHDEVLKASLQPSPETPTIPITYSDEVTDEMLVSAVVAGDERSFSEIFDRYKRHVTRVVARFFNDRDDIEEFAQQSFTKAYFSLKNYRGVEEKSLPAWLSRIAVNVCYDEFRRRKRKGETTFTDLSDEETSFVETIVDDKARSEE